MIFSSRRRLVPKSVMTSALKAGEGDNAGIGIEQRPNDRQSLRSRFVFKQEDLGQYLIAVRLAFFHRGAALQFAFRIRGRFW